MTKTSLFVIFALVFATFPAWAEDWTTTDGKIYKNVTVVSHDATVVTISSSDGMATFPIALLEKNLQKRIQGDNTTAKDWTITGKDYHNVSVTKVDGDTVSITYDGGAGTVNMADLPIDVQKKLGHDPEAAAALKAQQDAKAAADLKAQQDAKAAADSAQQAALKANDLHTKDGKLYKKYKIDIFLNDSVDISYVQTLSDGTEYDVGSAIIPYSNLPDDFQKQYAPDPNANKWHDDFAESEKQLQDLIAPIAAKASEDYSKAGKITVTGQVFIVTKGGDNIKLGGVHVKLYTEEEVETMIKSRQEEAQKKMSYNDPRIEKAKIMSDAADKAIESLEYGSDGYSNASNRKATANNYYSAVLSDREAWLSSDAYFDAFPYRLADAETDADAKFSISVPTNGKFVLIARASRKVGDSDEYYYWMVRLAMNGENNKTILLNNENITASGSPSLSLQQGF